MIARIVCAAAVAFIGMLPVAGRAGAIEPYERGTMAAIRAAHANRPLVVHFWSITCAPCLTEMPRLATIAHEQKDFDLVLVAADPITQRDRIATRLDRFGFGSATTFAFADAFEERLRFEADRRWRGELPFTIMISPSGTIETAIGELEVTTLAAWIASNSQH